MNCEKTKNVLKSSVKFILEPYYIIRLKDIKDNLKTLEDLDGYYILYSIHSAKWGSIWTWDLRAH